MEPEICTKMLTKLSEKLGSKMSCHYTWLLLGQICPSQWRFLGSFFNCKQAQQKANYCSENKRKGEKGKAKKIIRNLNFISNPGPIWKFIPVSPTKLDFLVLLKCSDGNPRRIYVGLLSRGITGREIGEKQTTPHHKESITNTLGKISPV